MLDQQSGINLVYLASTVVNINVYTLLDFKCRIIAICFTLHEILNRI